MKRNPHIIVRQVCPMKKTDDGKCRLKYLIPVVSGVPIWLPSKACVTEEYLQSCLPCKARGIYGPVRLPRAVPPAGIGMARPPQPWRYLTDGRAAVLRRKNP